MRPPNDPYRPRPGPSPLANLIRWLSLREASRQTRPAPRPAEVAVATGPGKEK
jgi:hypothetical protein